jgi:hypothetical protein
MWTRRVPIIWCRVELQKGRNIRFSLPLSLRVFIELLDCADDLLSLLCIFTPKTASIYAQLSPHHIEELISALKRLLRSIAKDGPYDLVTLSADQLNLSIKVK